MPKKPPATLQETKPSVPLKQAYPRETLGDTGTQGLHGIITEEYNPQLQGIQGIKIFDEMRKSDGTVRAAILVCTLPIRQAEWIIKPGTEDEEGAKVREFVEHALFDCLDITWDDVVRQALLMVPFGVMAFEKVYGVRDYEGTNYVMLNKLAPRMPRSIQQWELADGTFGIQQIRQDGVLAQIPGSKLLTFINEREGDNYWGTSMIRAAYKHWYFKNNFYKIDAVAFERQGLGVPYVKMPLAYTANDEAKARTALQNLRANEEAFMVIPNGYEVGFMDMGGDKTRDPQNSITHHNREITKSVLAQFLELGAASGSGSRAVSEDHSDLFLNALMAIAKTITSEINKNLVKELVDLNFDGIKDYPEIEVAGLTKTDVKNLSDAYSALSTAGAIHPTEDDEQYVRALMKLPPRTPEQIKEAREKSEAAAAALAAGKDGKGGGASGEDPEDDMDDIEDPDDKGSDPLKKKASSHGCGGAEQKLAFDEEGFKTWRPLTFAEKKVSWKRIQKTIDEIESSFTAEAAAALTAAKADFMAKLHAALDAGSTTDVAALEIKFIAEYKAILKDAMKKSYEYGKNNVSTEMGIAVPANSAASLKNIDLAADTIATKAAVDIETTAKHSVANAIKNATPVLQAVGAIDAVLDAAIAKTIDDTAGVIVAMNLNIGRNDVFTRNQGMIYALQRSEVLDSRTCAYCLSVDGRIIKPTDAFAKVDIFHSGCRGIWVEILNDEAEKPPIGGIPKSISDRWGGEVNSVIQPKKPVVKKNSPAAGEAARRDKK